MSIPVIIEIAPPDPDVDPKTYTQSCAELEPLITGRIDETITTFVAGSTVPSPEDQDKMWLRYNTIGAPVGIYVFHLGVWTPPEPIVSARFGIFTGDPTLSFDANGKGLKGPGPIAGDYWGWHPMNGLGGTQNWSDRFLIAGRMDNVGIVGFSGGWRTNVNGAPEGLGGVAEITLDAANTYIPEIVTGRHDATADVDTGGQLLGQDTDPAHRFTLQTGNPDPTPISVVGPFVAVGFIQFTGYIN